MTDRRGSRADASKPLRFLTPSQIAQIDRYLADLDEFGRLTLVKQNGKLRFIEKTESVEACVSPAKRTK